MSKSTFAGKIDPRDADLYAFGLILIEMLTLQPPDSIRTHLDSKKPYDSLEGMKEARLNHDEHLVAFAKMLLTDSKDKLRQAFSDVRENPPDAEIEQSGRRLSY